MVLGEAPGRGGVGGEGVEGGEEADQAGADVDVTPTNTSSAASSRPPAPGLEGSGARLHVSSSSSSSSQGGGGALAALKGSGRLPSQTSSSSSSSSTASGSTAWSSSARLERLYQQAFLDEELTLMEVVGSIAISCTVDWLHENLSWKCRDFGWCFPKEERQAAAGLGGTACRPNPIVRLVMRVWQAATRRRVAIPPQAKASGTPVRALARAIRRWGGGEERGRAPAAALLKTRMPAAV